MSTYVQKINGNYLAAYEVVPGSNLERRIRDLEVGAFQVVDPVSQSDFTPNVQNPSTKIIYLTKDPASQAYDPYYEWIYEEAQEGQVAGTWRCIGTTSMNLRDYKTVQTAVADPTVPTTGSNTSIEFIDTISQNENGVITPTKKRIPLATSTNPGIVKLGSDTVQTEAAELVSSSSGRTYAVQFDSNGNLVVNVPWTDAGAGLTFEQGFPYNPSSNPAVTVGSITSRIEALDATVNSTGGTNVALSVTEVDGVIDTVTITTDNTENKSNKITAWGTPTNEQYPSAKLVKDTLDAKQAAVTGLSGNFAGFNSSGELYDSGYDHTDFATAAQGALADTALQGGKIVGEASDLTVTNKILQIPKADIGTPATSASQATPGDYGVVQIECINI